MRFHEGSARHARETLNGKLAEKLLRTKLTWCLSVYRLKERRCFRIFCVNCVICADDVSTYVPCFIYRSLIT